MKGKDFNKIAYKNGAGKGVRDFGKPKPSQEGWPWKPGSTTASVINARTQMPQHQLVSANVTRLCPNTQNDVWFRLEGGDLAFPGPLSLDQVSLVNLQESAGSRGGDTLYNYHSTTDHSSPGKSRCPLSNNTKQWWRNIFITGHWKSRVSSSGPSQFHTGIPPLHPPSLHKAPDFLDEFKAEPWDLIS